MKPSIKPYSRMRELRVERGLTVAELAALVGVHPKTITHIERWQAEPAPDVMERIADVLEAAPCQLLEVSAAPIWKPLRAGRKNRPTP
jgi:transcriptional regulator with XRE-family HTH domain